MRSIWKSFFGPPTREQFARRVILAVRRRGGIGETRSIDYDVDRFALRLGPSTAGGGESHTLYLFNAYNDFCTARGRKERRRVLSAYAGTSFNAFESEMPLAQARDNLLPRVRERCYYASFELNVLLERASQAAPAPTKPPLEGFEVRPFNEELTLEIVLDQPTSIRSVNTKSLADWGLSFEDALAIGKDNLWGISNQGFRTVRPGLYLSPWTDTHDASRLFLHELLWQLKVTGDHVAAVPNRNVLIVTGSEDEANLLALAEMMTEALAQPRPMTGTAFRLNGSRWVPFLPPPASPAYRPLHAVAARSRGADYAEQERLLSQLYEKTGRDVFVAKQSLMQRKDGSIYSWTSWVEGITDALMPQADYVLFGGTPTASSQARQDGVALWKRVRDVLGHRMQPTELFPPRWQVATFPDAGERAAMELRPIAEMARAADG